MPINAAISILVVLTQTSAEMNYLFADTALPAILRAVLAILAVLAGMTWIGTRAGRRENV
jgi:uncharacterized integral membrane protein